MSEQRLKVEAEILKRIDAIRPSNPKKSDYTHGIDVGLAMAKVAIKGAPTIEERKTGKWIWVKEDKYRCSECNQETRVDEIMGVPMYACCPYCKADMTDYDGNVLYKR